MAAKELPALLPASLAGQWQLAITKDLLLEQRLVVYQQALRYKVLMENAAGSQRVPLRWRVVALLPLVPAAVLQVLAHRQSDLHAEIRFSTIGTIFLSISLIAQSLNIMRTSPKWGIAMLIFTSAVMGFGLHTLLRLL